MEGVWRRVVGHGGIWNSECVLWVISVIVHVMGGEGERLVCRGDLDRDRWCNVLFEVMSFQLHDEEKGLGFMMISYE